jgi:hypothetical protein
MMKKLLLLPFLFITVISFGQVPNYVPSNGLVGWWGFNGNANDASVNTNDGTVNGATLTTDRFGNASSAYDFDGLDDRIEVPNSNSLNPANVTFNFWMYANSDNVCVLSKKNHNDATNQSYTITHQEIWNGNRGLSTSWGADCILTGSIADWGPLGAVPNNNWVMLTITIDSSGLCKQYINTVLNYTFDEQDFFTCNNSNSPLFFGYHWAMDHKSMNGILDDIGIWSRVLDSCVTIDLYNASLGNCCALNPITSQPTNQSTSIGNDATFSFTDNLTGATYQWQMDAGTGYTNLSNAGQFSGTYTQTLTISSTSMGNNNTLYRCVVTESASCSDTTDVSTLTVIDNPSPDCIGDLNGDGFVTLSDLTILLTVYGSVCD